MHKCICKEDGTQRTTTDNAVSKNLDNLFYFTKKIYSRLNILPPPDSRFKIIIKHVIRSMKTLGGDGIRNVEHYGKY